MTSLPTPPAPDLAPIVDLPGTGPEIELPNIDAPEQPTIETWSVVAPAEDPAQAGHKVRVLLVEELDRVASHLAGLLAPDPRVKLVETASDGRAAVERIIVERPDVIIIDALLQGELSGMEVARALRAANLETPIVFLTVPERPLTVPPELGLTQVLSLPIEGHVLLTTIHDVDDAYRGQAMTPGGIVAVFSAAGGAGRTTLAHALALAFQQRPDVTVALMDGDQAHGDLRLHLGAPEAAPSLLQLPTGHTTVADVEPLLWQDRSELDVLLAPPRMEQADLIMLTDIRRAVSVLRNTHDILVIDVPVVMDDTTLALLDEADVVVDVIRADPSSQRKTRRCHDVLNAAAFPMDRLVHVASHTSPGVSFEATALLERKPDASLPFEQSLTAGDASVLPGLIGENPETPFGKSVVEVAAMILERVAGASRPAARAA